jgi:uncharacterized membrane protein (UPF0127 family)
MKSIKVGLGKKRVLINAKSLSLPEQFIGLMFKSRESDNLLFNIGGRWGIHSFFVFFDFLALWLDEKNNVLEYKIVKPFTFSIKPKSKFAKLIEIPLNSKNKNLISHFPSVYGKV